MFIPVVTSGSVQEEFIALERVKSFRSFASTSGIPPSVELENEHRTISLETFAFLKSLVLKD